MPARQFSASAIIEAPSSLMYAIIADYRAGHPAVLPRPPFVSLEVEQGGRGEGTVVCVRMRVYERELAQLAALAQERQAALP